MAERREVQIVDDLDGSLAVETVRVALDGLVYEIDLGEANLIKLRQFLLPFLTEARVVGSVDRPRKR